MLTKLGKLIGNIYFEPIGNGKVFPNITLKGMIPFSMRNSNSNETAFVIPFPTNVDVGNRFFCPTPYQMSIAAGISSQTRNTNPGVKFGTGTTLPTENDAGLASQITNGISFSNSGFPVFTNEYDLTNNIVRQCFTYSITNTSGSEITITEIALFAVFQTSDSKEVSSISYSDERLGCIDHTLLETPVVIPAGETGAVKYTFVYDFSGDS